MQSSPTAETIQSLEELASVRQKRIDELSSEIEVERARSEDKQRRISQLQNQLEEVERAKTLLEIENKRLKHDADLYKKQLEWQKKESEDLSKELLDTRRSNAERSTKLGEELARARALADGLEARSKEAEAHTANSMARIKQVMQENAELKERQSEERRSRESEVDAHKRLVEHLKSAEASATLDAQRFASLATEAQQALAQADAKFAGEKSALEESLKREVEQYKTENESLRSEVSKLKDLSSLAQAAATAFEASKELSPTAGEAALKAHGLSATALYTSLAQETELRREVQLENARLNSHLNHIRREIEAKAPLLLQSRQDYEQCLAKCDEFRDGFIEASREKQELKERCEGMENRVEALVNENEALKQDAQDLAFQVQSLLKATSGSGIISSTSSDYLTSLVSSTALTTTTPPRSTQLTNKASSEALITENLVTFSSVAELHERHQQLLRVIRRLAKEQEAQQVKESKAQSDANDARLLNALDEIKKMSEQRKRQEDLVNAIVAQRDMYRALLASSNAEKEALMSSSSVTALAVRPSEGSEVAVPSSTPSQDALLLAEVRADFTQLREETRRLQAEAAKTTSDLRAEAHTLRVRLASAESDRDFQKSRHESLNALHEADLKEVSRLRSSQEELHVQLVSVQGVLEKRAEEVRELQSVRRQLESSLAEQKSKADNLSFQMEQTSVHLTTLVEQREAQRRVAENLEAQLASLRKDFQSQTQVISAERERLSKRAEESDAEAKRVRAELASVQSALQSQVTEVTFKLTKANEQLVKLQVEHESLVNSRVLLSEQLESANKVAASVRELRIFGQTSAASSSSSGTTSAVESELRAEFDLCKQALEHVREQLAAKTQDADVYKSISASNEEALKNMTALSEQIKSEYAVRVQSLEEERAALSAQLERLSSDSKSEKDLRERALTHAQSIAEDLKTRLNESEVRSKELEAKLKVAAEDVAKFGAAAREANQNYARELQLHAADATALAALRSKLEGQVKVENDLRNELSAVTTSSASSVKELSERLAAAERAVQEKQAQLADFANESRMLTEQLERVSRGASGSAENVDVARLEELHRISSKRSTRLAVENEDLQLEITRLQAQLAQAQKELDRARTELTASVGPAQARTQDAERLMSAVQENAVMRNLNAFMTQEQTKLRERLEETEIKLSRAGQENENFKAAALKARAEAQAAQSELASRMAEISLLQTKLDDTLARFGSTDQSMINEKEALAEQVTELQGKLEKAESRAREFRTSAFKFRHEATEAQTKIESLTTQLTEIEKQRDGLLTDARANEEKLQALSEEISKKSSELAEVEKKLEFTRTTLDKFRKRCQEEKELRLKLEDEVRTIKQEYQQQQDQHQQQQQQQQQQLQEPAQPSTIEPIEVAEDSLAGPSEAPIESIEALTPEVIEEVQVPTSTSASMEAIEVAPDFDALSTYQLRHMLRAVGLATDGKRVSLLGRVKEGYAESANQSGRRELFKQAFDTASVLPAPAVSSIPAQASPESHVPSASQQAMDKAKLLRAKNAAKKSAAAAAAAVVLDTTPASMPTSAVPAAEKLPPSNEELKKLRSARFATQPAPVKRPAPTEDEREATGGPGAKRAALETSAPEASAVEAGEPSPDTKPDEESGEGNEEEAE